MIENEGTAGPLNMSDTPSYILRQKKIGNPASPFNMGMMGSSENQFDGLACNDEGYFIAFEELSSSFAFNTPQHLVNNISLDAMTVEFWIKPTGNSFYSPDKKVILFVMKDTEETLQAQRESKNLQDTQLNLDDKSGD